MRTICAIIYSGAYAYNPYHTHTIATLAIRAFSLSSILYIAITVYTHGTKWLNIHMVISFIATLAELDRIELVFGSLPSLRVWALLPTSPDDSLCITCDLPESSSSIIHLLTQ